MKYEIVGFLLALSLVGCCSRAALHRSELDLTLMKFERDAYKEDADFVSKMLSEENVKNKALSASAAAAYVRGINEGLKNARSSARCVIEFERKPFREGAL